MDEVPQPAPTLEATAAARGELACLDGEIAPSAETMIPVTDDGLVRGDGVFEVIRVYDGRPFALTEHLDRLERSAANLKLRYDVPRTELEAEVPDLVERTGGRAFDGAVRMMLTRGGRRIVLTELLEPPLETARVGFVTYAPSRILDGVKSLSYAANMLAGRLAKERGFDEALLVTPHGRVLEGPTSTFLVVLGGQLVTPPLGEHLLDSITRRRVLESTEVVERPVTVDELRSASGAALASTVREVHPVSAIEDVELAVDGPVTQEAGRRVRAAIEAELGATPASG